MAIAANAQSLLGQYVVSGQPGSEATLTASSVATGLTFTTLSRVGAGTNALADSYSSQKFSGASTLDNTSYLTFAITVDALHSLTLSNLQYTDVAGSAGPASFALEYSTNNVNFTSFSTYTPTTTITNRNVSAASVPVVSNGTVYIWMDGYNAPNQGNNNTYSLVNNPLAVNGIVASTAPEPGALVLMVSGVPLLGCVYGCRRHRR